MRDWLAFIVSSRGLSLVVAGVYLLIVLLAATGKSVGDLLGALLITIGGLLFPLACIWFGDELGEYVGMLPGPAISTRSPGWMVKLGGWCLLLLPAIIALFLFKSS